MGLKRVDADWLSNAGLSLSTQGSYRDMVNFLSLLSFEQRQQIFLLYKAWLQNMSAFLKAEAH